MPQDLPLEPDLIKVLASDTRREILRLLRDRNMTVTELARALDLGKATVHEHLNKLTAAELVQRKEDDRLWVYYELSPYGKRALNPQRTRFYLMVAVSVLAGVVAVLALALFLSTSQTGPFVEEGGPETFGVQVPERVLYATGPVEFQALLEDPSAAEGMRAYLVPGSAVEQDAENLPPGYPLEVEQAASVTSKAAMAEDGAEASDDAASRQLSVAPSGSLTLRSMGTLQPGTYVLYLTDGSGERRSEPVQVVIEPLAVASEQTTWYRQVSRPLTVHVVKGGTGLDGSLALSPVRPGPSPVERLTVEIEDGAATFPASSLDALAPGAYEVQALPEGSSRWLTTGEEIAVVQPQVSVTPSHVLAGQASQVAIKLWPHEAGEAVRLTGDPDPRIQEVIGKQDGMELTVVPEHPGTIPLEIGRGITRAITAHPDLAPTLEVIDGPAWRLTLVQGDGQPAGNVTVLLDGELVGLTNATGQLTMDIPPSGQHRLTLRTLDGQSVERLLAVDGWEAREIPHPGQVRTTARDPVPGLARLTFEVASPLRTTATDTLVAEVNGQAAFATDLPSSTDNATQVDVDIPVPQGGKLQVVADLIQLEQQPLQVRNTTAPPAPEA
ncbi:MAG: winged helix-turn-helix domain-containing protein, partial [Candidatus Thermoplasmatota archaeon]|nr:winged helix-turn-helix domain-containing protein [Candidatus Thermoplasmatota archaeon]